MSPFLILSLPRSRSAWLSVFLGGAGRPVGHDIGIECDTPDIFAERLNTELAGTCETGAAFAWPLIRRLVPGLRTIVVWRNPIEVANSLERFGFRDQLPEMLNRTAFLRSVATQDGVMSVNFGALALRTTCRAVYEFATQAPFDVEAWARLDAMNIQVDMRRRIDRLIERGPAISRLKADVERRLVDA